MKKTFLLTALLFFSYILSLAQDHNSIANKFVESALIENKSYNWLKDFCKIGPRLSGSENSLKAISWAKNLMEHCKFDSVWLQPVMVPHWIRGKNESAVLQKSKRGNKKLLTVTALGGSIATPQNGIKANVIEVQSIQEAKNLGEKAKGKIIFYNRHFNNALVGTMEAYGQAVDQRSSGAIAAASVGAVAVLVRSIQSSYDHYPHTGSLHYVDTLPKIPAAAISVIDADLLSKSLKEDSNLTVKLKLSCKTLPDAQSFNVIGDIKGIDKPNEVIVIGGHIDSWDKGSGANDDGASCMQSIEALELFKRFDLKPKKTLRAVLFINEENGLKGGLEYGKYAGLSKEEHIAAIEVDRGAATPRGFYVQTDSITFLKIQKWLPILNKAKIDWLKPGGSGGDVGQIKNTKAQFGYVPDDQRYMDYHHSATDTFDKVHPREMELGSAALGILLYLISENGL